MHSVDPTTEQMIRSVLAYAENRLRLDPVPLDESSRDPAEFDAALKGLLGDEPHNSDQVLGVYTSVMAPAVISADSPQALSDLARGARDLQQALQSAGLDLADDGLRFTLSSNGQGSSFAQAQAQPDQFASRTANAAEPLVTPEATVSRPLSIDSWRGARVDLMA